ncbi:TrbC family F-type conjugative pilus assembly protein [Endozoicomonas gorgoniicola]|uniref:TrbC family F-type conjugative pilus assembly protein n=1 Tax=Endozoicomonas gorgoniicola TaxID=1234144 RepID=A0ABT3MTI4_9GAMM|nr:TrbC family F-type conjugative pilus assembly protein [Endozoicomonas gorgoniicola]MCW7552691.1 TrbC family F-type conjugative pilus assembly protein [Endozoicomonas gorgoniicola]
MHKLIAIICIMIIFSTAMANELQIKLFVSASMDKSLLTALLKKSAVRTFIVRGIEGQHQNLGIAIQKWQQILMTNRTTTTVEINPVAFREYQIDRVPAITLQVDGKTELTAFGVTSVDWLMRQYQSGRRGHLGIYGTTYPISEPDLLEVLLQRLSQQDWQAVKAKTSQRLQSKVLSFGAKLPTSRQASIKVLKISGHWRTPIIALDINDRQQQKAVIPWLQQYPDALVLVSNGSLQHFQTLSTVWHQHPIYIMPPELIHRFQLTALPTLLTPESQNHWRVTTAEVSQFSAIDVMSWARALISKSAQSAYAVEATDNPSKALCQNVPILSEKLISSVPWKELFPIRIGLAKLGSGKEPNHRAKTSTGLCMCEDSAGMFHPGVTTGFWRPQRLIELTRSPGCLMALGGHKLPMVDQRRWGTLGSANIPKGLTYLHAHVYSLPLIEMLNMFTGIGGCTSDLVDFDLMNLSEVDPSWNHPELAALLSPDLAAYANPAAMNACTADGLAALNSQPMDSLHWCAGSWGNLYPLSGFTSTYGHFADNTSLLATRALAKIHRIGLARKTVGADAQCHSRITPWLPKSQYKMSMFWPEPEKQKAHWVGASAATWGMHRHPLGKDDAMYLIWQYRDCCQTAVSQ